jgi:hypothetical protein
MNERTAPCDNGGLDGLGMHVTMLRRDGRSAAVAVIAAGAL